MELGRLNVARAAMTETSCQSSSTRGPSDPDFQIVFLFHRDLDLLSVTLPRCIDALTSGTREAHEVVLVCDGTPPDVASRLPPLLDSWGVDEMRIRRRGRSVASGDPSNNGHRRCFATRSPYVIVVEDDVVMYRSDASFDVLAACRYIFVSNPEVPVLSRVDDFDKWSWQLEDLGEPVAPGIRSVNRLSTHFVVYDVGRFRPVAARFGAFDLDVFIDRDDLSYNWEDLVSHVGTTGGRKIAFPSAWPLQVFHCDVKVADGSMHNTQDPAVKAGVLAELEARFRPDGAAPDAVAAR